MIKFYVKNRQQEGITNMAICKICKKSFHACNNCGLDYEQEYSYCSENCYKQSNDYTEWIRITEICKHFLYSIPENLLKELQIILENSESRNYFSSLVDEKLSQ